MKKLLQLNFSNQIDINENIYLCSRFIDEDARVSKKSYFKDAVWEMAEFNIVPGSKNYQKKFDFSKVPGFPDGFALSLAEYAYARLYNPPDHYDQSIKWATALNELITLKAFVNYCHKNNINSFNNLLTQDFVNYYKHLENDVDLNIKSSLRVRKIFVCIHLYYEFNSRLSYPITSQPLGMSIEKFFGKNSKTITENATPPIPESVFNPLIVVALKYVENHSIQLLRELEIINALWDTSKNTQVSYRQDTRLYYKQAQKFFLEQEYNWRKKQIKNLNEFSSEIMFLRTACTIIVLAFSGIRPSELLSLNFGCLSTTMSGNDNLKYYISGKVFKKHGNGSNEKWVVIPEVHKAIEILQKLVDPIRLKFKKTQIFITDGTNQLFSSTHEIASKKLKVLHSDSINCQINRFKSHINNLIYEPIPTYKNEKNHDVEWNFCSSQFRRTLARSIARQPFGIIAGMIQYKHVKTTIFEGYAGREKSFNSILNLEQDLADLDILKEVSIDISNGRIAGVGGQNLKNALENEFKGRAEDYKPSQIFNWLTKSQKSLYVGKYNFCFFDPAKALCIEGLNDRSKPILNSCTPQHCKNSCISNRHIPLWKAQLNQAENLASITNSNNTKELLSNEINYLKTIIEEFKET